MVDGKSYKLSVTVYDPRLTAPDVVYIGKKAVSLKMKNGAKQCSWEKETGSIEVGKSADMVVLDRNIYEIPAETIHDTLPLITVFRGEEVYKA